MSDLFFLNQVDVAQMDAERQRVTNLLSGILDEPWIFEVGSTAVEGLIGKQDLDFLVRVPASKFGDTRRLLDQILERNMKQLSNSVYQGYVFDSALDVAVQLTIIDSPHDTFLEFLSLLRNDPELRNRYNQLKRKYHGQPMKAYRLAKSEFIENVLNAE